MSLNHLSVILLCLFQNRLMCLLLWLWSEMLNMQMDMMSKQTMSPNHLHLSLISLKFENQLILLYLPAYSNYPRNQNGSHSKNFPGNPQSKGYSEHQRHLSYPKTNLHSRFLLQKYPLQHQGYCLCLHLLQKSW